MLSKTQLLVILLGVVSLTGCLQSRVPRLFEGTPVRPVVEWADAPACENQPQDLAAWRLWIEQQPDDPAIARQLQGYLWRGQAFTPLLHNTGPADLLARLESPDTAPAAEVIARELTILWLNIISGRLNRATELEISTHPELHQVVDLVGVLTKALSEDHLSAELLEASRQLQSGENISRHVCARLVYRTGAAVRESVWTDDGYVEQDQLIAEAPPGITSFSPDFTRLAIETPWNDSGGGPIYLFNMKTNRLFNLNQVLSLHEYGGPLGLTISGWHPLGDRLLLVDEDDNIVVWTDVNRENQQRITLNPDPKLFTPIRQVELAPDGNSFIYVVDGPDNKTTVHQYQLTTQETHTLATLPVDRGRLRSFRFSPLGEMAAYVQSKGQRATGRTYAMELFNLETYTVTTLIEGNLGQTEPVWSPDGQKIAFVRKALDEPDMSGPDQAQPWQGNIWVAFLASGEIRQITFVTGAAQRPVWSPDSHRLAFITGDNELGLVDIDQPGIIWRLGATITRPQFTTIAFVP